MKKFENNAEKKTIQSNPKSGDFSLRKLTEQVLKEESVGGKLNRIRLSLKEENIGIDLEEGHKNLRMNNPLGKK